MLIDWPPLDGLDTMATALPLADTVLLYLFAIIVQALHETW